MENQNLRSAGTLTIARVSRQYLFRSGTVSRRRGDRRASHLRTTIIAMRLRNIRHH